MEWRFFLDSTYSGLLEIDEPVSYRTMELTLDRDKERHGVMKEYSVEFKIADKKGIDYIVHIYENEFIDANIEIVIKEFDSASNQWMEVFRGKVNIDQRVLLRTKLRALTLSATITKTDDDMRFYALRDQSVDLESNLDFDGNTLPSYAQLPGDLILKHRTLLRKLDLENNYVPLTQIVNTNGYGTAIFQTSCGGSTNGYANELLVDEWLIPIDNANYPHTFNAYIPIPFNNVVLDELNVASDFGQPTIYQTIGSMPSVITTDAYSTAAVSMNLEAIIAMCILYCSEGNIPKVYAPGSYGSCVAGMDWDAVSLKVDIGGVNVYSNWLFGGVGLAKNGHTTDFLDNGGDFYLFDYFGNITTNTATGCINPNTGATFTGAASDLIHKGSISDNWSGTVPELSYCKIYLEVVFGGTYQNTYAGNPGANVQQKLYGFTQALFNSNTWLKATLTHKFKDTPCKSFMIHEAFSRTVEAITSGSMKVYSKYFGRVDSAPFTYVADGCGSLRCITTGLHVRQFPSHLDTAKSPNNKAMMAISFDKLFESQDAIDCLGYGIEVDPTDSTKKVVRVEPVEYFYDKNTVIMECDEVSELKRAAKTDAYYSKFQFGYNKWEAESTMGLDEFNTTREYRSVLKTIKKTLTKICDFIASGYTLEVERHEEMVNDATKDTNYDNEVFMICLRRDGSNIVVEQGVDCLDVPSVANVIDPDTVYNARISPNRNFIRWLKVLNHTYFPKWNDSLAKWVFTKGDGNFNAAMQLISGCVTDTGLISESQDISSANASPDTFAKPFHKPDVVDYDYPCSWADFNRMKANPYGVVKFREFNNKPWELGFISSLKYRPEEGKATFELLPIYQ